MNIVTIILVVVVIILLFCTCKHSEYFTINSKTPNLLEKIVSLHDHKTTVKILQGNTNKHLILVYGGPLDQRCWGPLLEELASLSSKGKQIPTVYTYDLRGNGTACTVPIPNHSQSSWTLKSYTDDLYQIYSQLVKPAKVSIGGWSFGGLVAQKFALTYPKLMENLFLFSTVGSSIPVFNIQQIYTSWISPNTHIDYLTLPTTNIQNHLCRWFYVNNKTLCPTNTDTKDQTNSDYYFLAQNLLTVANARAHMQTMKIYTSFDLLTQWENATDINYHVYILSTRDDIVAEANAMSRLFVTIRDAQRRLKNTGHGGYPIVLDIVNGKHFYTFSNPAYIANIIIQDTLNLYN